MLVFVNIEKNNSELWACFVTSESFTLDTPISNLLPPLDQCILSGYIDSSTEYPNFAFLGYYNREVET